MSGFAAIARPAIYDSPRITGLSEPAGRALATLLRDSVDIDTHPSQTSELFPDKDAESAEIGVATRHDAVDQLAPRRDQIVRSRLGDARGAIPLLTTPWPLGKAVREVVRSGRR